MLNRAVIIGRLTRDPEVTISKKGEKERTIAKFTVAYNHRYRKGEEWVEEPHFFNIRAFGRIARTAGEKYHQGDLVFVEGRLSQDRWETESGERRTRITIVADTVRLIRAKGDSVTVEDANGKEESQDEEDSELGL